ncbi:MAG: TraX family protein [Sphaerochaetaceae bacterium]|jgi:hypothetical protein|nr:TraX family protein [Sphaerochaetaceae bacterium]
METKPFNGHIGVLSTNTLKLIAVLSMIIDHFGSIIMDGVMAPYMIDGYLNFTTDMPWLVFNAVSIKNLCEILGSIAFPIFCFMIAEGFIHTHNKLKYGLRVGLFALISEIPFDLAHYGELYNPGLQNVMFTLCISIFTLLAINLLEIIFSEKKALKWTLIVLSILAGMALAFLAKGEYVFLGVLTISLLYLLRNTGWFRLLGLAPLIIVSPWTLLAALPISMYSGKKGHGSKYFFYVFYPAHFLLFAWIAHMLSVRGV